MNDQLTGLQKKIGWSKSLSVSKILCSVCLCYRVSSSFTSIYCCSSSRHGSRRVCDSCVHQHIISILYSCLTNSVTCPEVGCRSILPHSVICTLLLTFDSSTLLNEYLREQQWQGKSDEWIKRFAARCPGCGVPIEKNGGCDEMICVVCQTHFFWSKAKHYLDVREKKKDRRSTWFFHPLVDGVILVLVFLFIILITVLYCKI